MTSIARPDLTRAVKNPWTLTTIVRDTKTDGSNTAHIAIEKVTQLTSVDTNKLMHCNDKSNPKCAMKCRDALTTLGILGRTGQTKGATIVADSVILQENAGLK